MADSLKQAVLDYLALLDPASSASIRERDAAIARLVEQSGYEPPEYTNISGTPIASDG